MEVHTTLASTVRIPIEMVQLEHLKTDSGDPVAVRCEAINEISVLRALRALPGASPPSAGAIDESDLDDEARLLWKAERTALLMERGTALIEAGAFLEGPDGRPVQAFYAKDPPPHPFAIPIRMLRSDDILLLVDTIARLSGFIGGEAEAETFRTERSGTGDGLGDVEGEPRDG